MPEELGEVLTRRGRAGRYGRRRALGIVLAASASGPGRETKPLLARVRSDGPLLPPVQVELARHVAAHYLAPPALVVRQMLAPGMLERVERRVRPGADGVEAEWRVLPAVAHERFERRVSLTDAGGAVAQRLADGTPDDVRGLGPRQRLLLLELHTATEPVAAARLAERHGTSALPGLLRRDLIVLQTVRVERRPRAGRAEPRRDDPGRHRPDHRAECGGRSDRCSIADGSHCALLLEGAPASGKSAV